MLAIIEVIRIRQKRRYWVTQSRWNGRWLRVRTGRNNGSQLNTKTGSVKERCLCCGTQKIPTAGMIDSVPAGLAALAHKSSKMINLRHDIREAGTAPPAQLSERNCNGRCRFRGE